MSVTFETKQLGKYRLDTDNKGNKYTLTHSVAPNDLVNYKYAYGTTITSDGNFVSDIPEDGCIIIQQTITNIGDEGYIVKTVAVDKNYYNQPINIRLNVDNDYDVSYDIASIKCLPSFWGLRVADDTDVSNSFKTRMGASSSAGLTCKKGDWLQPNVTSSSIGICNFNQCPIGVTFNAPFTNEADPVIFDWYNFSVPDYAYLNADIPLVVLTVRYTATKSPHLYGDFVGINPAGFSGTPAPLRPQETACGVWKSAGQQIRSYKVNNVTKYQVIRKMVKAPKLSSVQCAWLEKKNGGIWTW